MSILDTAYSTLKRFLPKSLFTRSFLILVIPVLLLQTASVWIFFNTHWDSLSRRLAINLAGEITLIAHRVETGNLAEARLAARTLDMTLRLEREVPWPAHAPPAPPRMARDLYHELAMRLDTNFVIRHAPNNRETLQVFLPVRDGGQWLRVSLSHKKIYSATALVFLGWSLGLSILLLAVAWIFLRNQIRPILRLARAADTFGLHAAKSPLRPQGAAEIRTAIGAFNRMQERIVQNMEQRTVMLAGISHDVRTPLTRLRLQLGLLDDALPTEAAQELLADVREIEQMVESYLAFARGDEGESPQTIALCPLLHEWLAPYSKEHTVHLPVWLPNALVTVQPQALRRVLTNLVENALQHATAVWVQAAVRNQTVEITIADNGPGIPPEHYEDALKPFYRLDTSRPTSEGGVGLGLAIAQQLIQQQPGGSLTLSAAPQGGLLVTITVMIALPSASTF